MVVGWKPRRNMFCLDFHPTIIRDTLVIISYDHGVICVVDAACFHRAQIVGFHREAAVLADEQCLAADAPDWHKYLVLGVHLVH